MRIINITTLVLLAGALVILFSTGLSAESMGVSQGYDLDALWVKAQKQYDLNAHDAVLLLEGRHVTILDNGNLKTRVHRVVRIGTEMGIEHYADLRISWNSATSTFTVLALRTWNDDRWWPHESEVSETAVVETLPFALAQADDYTSIRETMLLHDGVELPCIMETIYEIEEEGAASDGADDLFVFPQDDPTVLVEYVLTVPSATTPKYRSGNGAPEPEITTGGDKRATYAWKMENIARLKTPHTESPAVYEPHVIWSTWKDWETLGRKVRSSFHAASVEKPAYIDSLLDGRQGYEPSKDALVHGIAEFVNEGTRLVNYETRFWRFSPRPATRIWETGYGHALDRATLAAALFRRLGFSSRIVYRTAPLTQLDQDMPAIAPFEEYGVRVQGYNVDCVYDPMAGTCKHIYSWMHGVTIWDPSEEKNFIEQVVEKPVITSTTGHCSTILELESADEGKWEGKGYLRFRFGLSHYDDMAGIDDKAIKFIEKNVQDVLPGSHVKAYNPERFLPDDVAVGFDIEMAAPETDGLGRITFSIGTPTDGIRSGLPQNVHLCDEHRDSPILLDGRMEQRIKLRLKVGDREIVHLPEGYTLENDVGSFVLTIKKENGWITIDRKLRLERSIVQPEEWPLLRALLLEEQDPAHRTVILK